MEMTSEEEAAYFYGALGDAFGYGAASDYSGKPTLGPGDSGSSVSDLQRTAHSCLWTPASLGSWGPNKDGIDGDFGQSGSDTHNRVKTVFKLRMGFLRLELLMLRLGPRCWEALTQQVSRTKR